MRPHPTTPFVMATVVLAVAGSAGCSSAAGADATDGAATTAPSAATSSGDPEAWPPAEGTGGRWLAAPDFLVAPTGDVEACGTTITADYAPGTALEYQADVADGRTVVRYRAAAAADVDVVRADGARVRLDVAGPQTETYEDVDGDGEFDVLVVESVGKSVWAVGSPEEEAAASAAGLPAVSFWEQGTVTTTYTFAPVGVEEPPAVVVSSSAAAVQDVCQLLDGAAGATPSASGGAAGDAAFRGSDSAERNRLLATPR